MNKLPSEILYEIFSLLGQEQNLECMRVCWSWAHTLALSNLFRTVRIFTMNGLNNLVERVQKEPEKGTKIECLIFNLSIDDNFDMSLIPILFPKIRTFYLYHYRNKQKLEMVSTGDWNKHIQYFTEYTSSHLATQLLASGLCLHLKELSVDITPSNREIIPLLTSAPYLEKLKIANLRVTIDDLELLHASLPYLQSLWLQAPQLRGNRLSTVVLPATSLKVLKVESSDVFFIQTQIAFLQYVSEKYTNLKELSYSSACFDFREDEMNTLCRNGWMPLFMTLGSRLKSVNIDSNGLPVNIYQILDRVGCHLDRLYLEESSLRETLEGLKQSRQIRHIRTLVLTNHGIGFTGFGWLKRLVQLKELKVNCVYDTIVQFDDLLLACSDTVESLSIENGKLELDHSIRHLSFIKSLSFSKIFLPETIDTFISNNFYRLNALRLDNCQLYRRCFSLPMVDLNYFELTDYFPPNRHSILVKTLNNEVVQHKFPLLHQVDQLQYMLACRFWRNLVEEYTLFQSLYLTSSDSINTLIVKVQKKIKYWKQGEIFSTSIDSTGFREQLHILLPLSPNLQKIFSLSRTINSFPVEETTHHWSEHIEQMYEMTISSKTQLFIHDLYDIIPLWKTTPLLKYLTIDIADLLSPCQSSNLSITYELGDITRIIDSNQASYIQTLYINYENFTDGAWIKHLGVLKKLKMNVNQLEDAHHLLSFNEIIENSPPTLKFLSFENLTLSIDFNKTTTPVKIESLSFIALKSL
ncbi:hypothetical protein K501DRAFT_334707 [Backusella circina FSU 941]|nr:hypothetical protein K501DRAFT_334707 [Backusella circina FSU 941]